MKPAPAPACPVCGAAATRALAEVDARRYWRCGACEASFLDPAQLPGAALEQAEYLRHRNDPDDPGYRRFLARLAIRCAPASRPRRRGWTTAAARVRRWPRCSARPATG